MIDEHLISFSEAARSLPRRRANKPVHASCIFRWAATGCRGVKLEYVQIGGTRCTSREALERFFQKLTAQSQGESIAPPPPAKHRRRAIKDAEERLARAGI